MDDLQRAIKWLEEEEKRATASCVESFNNKYPMNRFLLNVAQRKHFIATNAIIALFLTTADQFRNRGIKKTVIFVSDDIPD